MARLFAQNLDIYNAMKISPIVQQICQRKNKVICLILLILFFGIKNRKNNVIKKIKKIKDKSIVYLKKLKT